MKTPITQQKDFISASLAATVTQSKVMIAMMRMIVKTKYVM